MERLLVLELEGQYQRMITRIVIRLSFSVAEQRSDGADDKPQEKMRRGYAAGVKWKHRRWSGWGANVLRNHSYGKFISRPL